jgi:hypothetical protein
MSNDPASLEALVPAYLSAAPQDPFSPNRLIYRLQGGRPLICSRGPDGDDDGGRDVGPRVNQQSNGDVAPVERSKVR